MGERGSITRGWKEEESCTRELFCVLGLGKPRPKTQNNSLVQDSSSFHPLVMEPLFLVPDRIDQWRQTSMEAVPEVSDCHHSDLVQMHDGMHVTS